MAEKKDARKETKSEFLRKALGKNPDLDYRQVNLKWAKAGHAGEISNALFYQVRAKLGIKTEWAWVKVSEPEPTLVTASGPTWRGKATPPKSPPAPTTGDVYQIKITLRDIQPPIWRRIQVPDCTLGELHEIIQTAMGWEHSHMHQFIINNQYYGETALDEMDLDMDMEDENGIRLRQIVKGSGKARIVYEYDFGDSWEHEILFEKTVKPEPKINYPRCVDGARACPPEDCGGSWGYADFLAAISNPKHESHRDMKEWIGGSFDPEKFSVDKVNQELGRSSRR
ncbi:MAG TPA: plasmid pRiA4b ORF-3 family protein [Isosphaeraceae bacterium]|nr:plasmid pRiA4b ORF-3 family protein [Isosphaeraceae bacterium]